MRNLLISVLSLVLLWSSPVLASGKPPELEKYVKATSPYGEAELYKFFMHIYDASVWTDSPRWSYDTPFALTIVYQYEFTTKQLVDRTIVEMERIHGKGAAWRYDLEKSFPDVKEGDRITAVFRPNYGVSFYYNGKMRRSIKSRDFAVAFFDIWLSAKTSEPSLRRDLLNLK